MNRSFVPRSGNVIKPLITIMELNLICKKLVIIKYDLEGQFQLDVIHEIGI